MPTKAHPVKCQNCNWKGTRKVVLPKECPSCKGNVVWDHTRAIVIDTPAGIEGVRLCTLKGALSLEIAGMKRHGRSAYSLIKEEFGFKGNKQAVMVLLIAHIAQFNRENRFTK